MGKMEQAIARKIKKEEQKNKEIQNLEIVESSESESLENEYNEPTIIMAVDLNGIKQRKRSKTPHDPSTPTILTYDQWEAFGDMNNANGSTTESQRLSLQNMYAHNSINRSRSSNLTISPNIISEDLNTMKHAKTYNQFQRGSQSSSRKFVKRHSDFSL